MTQQQEEGPELLPAGTNCPPPLPAFRWASLLDEEVTRMSTFSWLSSSGFPSFLLVTRLGNQWSCGVWSARNQKDFGNSDVTQQECCG